MARFAQIGEMVCSGRILRPIARAGGRPANIALFKLAHTDHCCSRPARRPGKAQGTATRSFIGEVAIAVRLLKRDEHDYDRGIQALGYGQCSLSVANVHGRQRTYDKLRYDSRDGMSHVFEIALVEHCADDEKCLYITHRTHPDLRYRQSHKVSEE